MEFLCCQNTSSLFFTIVGAQRNVIKLYSHQLNGLMWVECMKKSRYDFYHHSTHGRETIFFLNISNFHWYYTLSQWQLLHEVWSNIYLITDWSAKYFSEFRLFVYVFCSNIFSAPTSQWIRRVQSYTYKMFIMFKVNIKIKLSFERCNTTYTMKTRPFANI